MSHINLVTLTYSSDPSYRFTNRWQTMLWLLSDMYDEIPF